MLLSASAADLARGQQTTARDRGDTYTPADSLTLEEAIGIALKYDPQVLLAREKARAAGGRLRESSGLFDIALNVNTSYQLETSPLPEGTVDLENGKRDVLRYTSEELQRIADALREQLENDGLVYPDCPPGLEGIEIEIYVEGVLVDVLSWCVPITDSEQADQELILDLADALDQDAIQQRLIDANEEIMEDLIETLDDVSFRLRRALRQFGTVPTLADAKTLTFELSATKTFRNGLVISPGLRLESSEDNYRGKKWQGGWGGKGTADKHRSTLSLSVSYPLGKGRGAVSTAATERAARATHGAALEDYAHAVSAAALRTALAYWTLVGAQEQLALQEESAATAQRLLEIGQALLRNRTIVSADLAQIRARAAETGAQVASARQGFIEARLALGLAMGLTVERIADAPFAGQGWPAPPDTADIASWDPEILLPGALGRRSDIAAYRQRGRSAEILADGARADLKKRTDLSLSVSYRGLHEGGDLSKFSSLFDGYEEALFGYVPGPSFKVGLSFEWPFGNNEARGKLAQARSLQRQSWIGARDLERVTRGNVEDLAGALAIAAEEVAIREQAVADYLELVESQVARFRAGRSSVVDVVLTEQQLIGEQSALVNARQTFTTLLSRFRFELGAMLEYHIEDGEVVVERIHPSGYAFGS